MPYIKKERRKELEHIVELLKDISPNGEINYLLFTYCKRYVTPSYNNYKELIGELHCSISEIERRFLHPYEDKKIQENGDVE